MPAIEGRRIALIGGAGFIGHHLALALKAQGAAVGVIDGLEVNNLLHFSASNDLLQNRHFYRRIIQERLRLLEDAEIPLFVQDARDYHALSKILAEVQPQTIVHLAAISHAGKSNKDPYSTFDHSLRTLENALDFARGGGVEHFVFFSSSMVYGTFKSDIVDEDTPCEPLGIYGALKFAGEKIVIAYEQVFGLPYTIVRPSALYGERCVSRRVGQIFIESAMQGRDITVSGRGEERLDFTYIEDLVQGVSRVIGHERSRNTTLNLTYGASRSLAEMAALLQQRFPHIGARYVERDNLMPERGTLSVDRARRLIGYAPEYPLERGFAAYMDWYERFWDAAGESASAG